MIHSVAILGTGALGGFYGSHLQRAGCDAHFLVRSDFDHVRRHGLLLKTEGNEIRVAPVRAYSDATQVPKCDLVLVTMKATDNRALPAMLPSVVGPQSTVLILQNGFGIEDQVADIVGPDRVMGGLCFIAAFKSAPGEITHLGYGNVSLAEFRGGITHRLREIGEVFVKAGVPTELLDDLELARWKKLVWNIPFNGLSVVLGLPTNQIMANAEHRQRVEGLMREVVALAAARNRVNAPEFVEKMLTDTVNMAPYKTSMMLDFERGHPMELDAIYRKPLEVASAAGIQTPLIAELFEQLFRAERGRITTRT